MCIADMRDFREKFQLEPLCPVTSVQILAYTQYEGQLNAIVSSCKIVFPPRNLGSRIDDFS